MAVIGGLELARRTGRQAFVPRELVEVGGDERLGFEEVDEPARRQVRTEVARQLLERLNSLLVLGWRQKAQARAGVRLAIEDGLDEGLPHAYTKETYQTKCNALFEHVYESYMGDGKSSYTEAA